MDTFVLDLKDFHVKDKSLLNYTYLFLPNDYEKMIKQCYNIIETALVLSVICSKFKNEEIFKESRRINRNIKNFWFNWKYMITLKIWVKNLD